MRLKAYCLSGLFLVSTMFSCQVEPTKHEIQGSFGIFYGGGVRQPDEMILSAVQLPKLGFRLSSSESEPTDRIVRFRLLRPGHKLTRVKEFGRLQWGAEQLQLDHLLPWPEGLKRGYWSLRVTVDQLLVIDRSIYFRGAH